MSLEAKIDLLTEALGKYTAAITGAKASGSVASTSPKAGTTPKESAVTFETVKAAVVKVKNDIGKPAAQKIIKEAGKATELASIKPAQFAAVMAAAEAALAGEEPEESEDDSL